MQTGFRDASLLVCPQGPWSDRFPLGSNHPTRGAAVDWRCPEVPRRYASRSGFFLNLLENQESTPQIECPGRLPDTRPFGWQARCPGGWRAAPRADCSVSNPAKGKLADRWSRCKIRASVRSAGDPGGHEAREQSEYVRDRVAALHGDRQNVEN